MKFKRIFVGFIIIISTLLTNAAGFGNLTLPQQSFLSPDEAFKATAVRKNDTIEVDIKLGDKIYIYSKDLHFKVTKPIQLELKPKLPKAEKHGEYDGYRSISVDIPAKDIESKLNSDYTLTVEMTGCSDSGICYQPQTREILLKYQGEPEGFFEKISRLTKEGNAAKITDVLIKENPLFILFIFFIFGLLLALTPCIFPMIPILSSIIISQAGKGKAINAGKAFFTSLVYVIAMALTYTVVGVVAGLVGADIQAAMAIPWVIVLFAAMFVALAFSLFGFYEIGLPAKWQSKLNSVSDNAQSKGIVGTAIMGALSALIVGPCVAPPLGGAILFISQTGDAFLGGLALFVMSIGMGMPLLLVGLGAGKFMPKPGGWMMRISQIFGVMMLLMALYMIERLLPGWVTLMLASFIFMGSAFYMEVFGSCQSRKGLSKLATLFAFVMLIYGVILFIGAISGSSSILHPLDRFTSARGSTTSNILVSESEGSHRGYSVDRLLQEVVEASEKGKGVIVDIYKDGCVACVELENITFPDPQVQEQMKRFEFIRIDITDNTPEDQALLKKYGLFGAPNILFFDSKGKVLPDKFYTGFIPPEQFAKQMKSIK
ncbi:MAG: protein-disulfide reductase DsbD [Sulfurovum sp.]|nr:protein-disulfide reductase DsbD [Sulfurovum sp.]